MQDLEGRQTKIVVLGAQGVGKTSLLQRFIHNNFKQVQHPTIGANFLTKKIVIPEYPHITLRLQIWDTAGQERFRSISKLYYRGANAALLCYDITSSSSFDQMGTWLQELRHHNIVTSTSPISPQTNDTTDDAIIHVVGTKADVVAEDPHKRQVAFERCISYVAEHLQGVVPSQSSLITSPITPGSTTGTHPPSSFTSMSAAASRRKDSHHTTTTCSAGAHTPTSPSNRHSGFWGQDTGWDCCHEISSKDGEGVEEVFRVIAKKLIEQQLDAERRNEIARDIAAGAGQEMAGADGPGGYFDGYGTQGSAMDRGGSFRLGYGDKRRSWLGLGATPVVSVPGSSYGEGVVEQDGRFVKQGTGGRCC